MKLLEPKIFVICLSAYKNGKLHGAWMDANQSIDALYTEVQEMLAGSPMYDAELFSIHDYQGFGNIKIKKHTSLEEFSALASVISYLQVQGIVSLQHWNKKIKKMELSR